MHPPLCIVGLRRRSHDLRSGCLKNAEGLPAYYPNGWVGGAGARHPQPCGRLLMTATLRLSPRASARGLEGGWRERISHAAHASRPSPTLGVTAWRDAVRVGFTGGRAVCAAQDNAA